MTSQVALVLGVGPNTGQTIANALSAKGYKVAAASRSRKTELVDQDHLNLHVELSDPPSIVKAFEKVKSTWGPPSTVVFNAAMRTVVDRNDPFAQLSLDDFEQAMSVNLRASFVAVQQAIAGFKELPPSVNKTYFHTGNKLNKMPLPEVLLFGMAKNAAAHMIWDATVAYKDLGFRFYYTDERFEDGSAAREARSAEAAATECIKLVESDKQEPWHYTFVKGRGYTDFHEIDHKNPGH